MACTGRNDSGQFGLGNTNDSATWVGPIGGLLNPVPIPAVKCGGAYTYGFWGTASAWYSWGSNSHGQLGRGLANGTFTSTPDRPQPTNLNFDVVVCGYTHVVAKRAGTQEWYSCGSNASYELGLGDNTGRNTFIRIPNTWEQMKCGRNFTLALKDGTWYCVGANTYGQFGFGNTNTVTTWTPLPDNYSFGTGKDWNLLEVGLDHIVGYRDVEIIQA